jgi:hypothetical protein
MLREELILPRALSVCRTISKREGYRIQSNLTSLTKGENEMKKGLPMLILAIYLIVAGILAFIPNIPFGNYILGVLALVAGVLLLLQKK